MSDELPGQPLDRRELLGSAGVLAAGGVLLGAGGAGAAVEDRGSAVKITNLFFNGVKGNNEPDEYVEITNSGSQPVDITDWVLKDPKGDDEYKWEGFTLQPGQMIRVYTNEVHPESGGFTFGASHAIWANSGGTTELYDSDQQLVSRYPYGSQQ